MPSAILPLPTHGPVEPGRLNRNAIRPPSRLGLSEPQPGALSPFSSPRPTTDQTCAQSACSDRDSSTITVWATVLHESTGCWGWGWGWGLGLPAARPDGTAITPLHSPEIVGQIFRDLSAIRCLSAPLDLVRSGSAAPASTPRLVQPASSCSLPLAQGPRYLVTDHSRGWRSFEGHGSDGDGYHPPMADGRWGVPPMGPDGDCQ